jgi:hypothetical protein
MTKKHELFNKGRSRLMNNLQEITIKVPSEIAEAYQQATELEKQNIITRISFLLQPISSDKTRAI